jgi:hypothetical protein
MRQSVLALVSVLLLGACAQTQMPLRGTTADRPIPIASADLKWVDLDPVGAPGVQIATLWGDMGNGPFGAFFRLPAGFASPLHRHTHAMKVVTVSGTYIQRPAGEPVFHLSPGSYLMQPGGNYRHWTSCGDAEDCIFFVESDGGFDFHVVD